MHSYLCHLDWSVYIKRYAQHNLDKEQKNDNDLQLDELWDIQDEHKQPKESEIQNNDVNKDKYITKIDGNKNNYGFGVIHEYHHLKPIWNSIKDELEQNNLCQIGKSEFIRSLIKSIEFHKIAKRKYKAKYFDPNYNIIRGEAISIIYRQHQSLYLLQINLQDHQ